MSVDFASLLTTDQKRQVLSNRITQFAAEAYQHTLNKRTAEKVGAKEKVAEADKALKTIEAAILVHKEELEKLPTPKKTK